MKNSNSKSTLITAAMFLLLAGTGMKSYAQPTITLTAKNGIALSWDDIYDSYGRYDEHGNPNDDQTSFNYAEPHHIVINAQTFHVGETDEWGNGGEVPMDMLNFISATSSTLTEVTNNVLSWIFVDLEKLWEGENTSSFTTVNFPNVVKVGSGAFSRNEKLTSVNMPSVKTLGSGAFSGCIALPSITMPNVDIISGGAFGECISLETAYFPGAESIEALAFSTCTSLDDVHFPNVIEIQDTITMYGFSSEVGMAFAGCTALPSIALYQCKYIGVNSFWGCLALHTVDIPRVELIKKQAFRGCSALRTVSGPGNGTIIDESAFEGCTSLRNFELLNTVRIGNYAFMGCTSLERVEFSESPASVGDYAFGNCTSLKYAYINTANKEMGGYVFEGCTALETVYLPHAKTITKSVFEGCYALVHVDLSDVITVPGLISESEGIFENRQKLLRVELDNCQYMGNRAFKGCSSLNFMDLPNCVFIGDYAFQDNTSLSYFSAPKLTHIGKEAFAGCTSLSEANFPHIGANTLEEKAFSGCTNLTKVRLGTGHTVPTTVNVAANAFDATSNIELILGENVLPQPEGNSWNGNTWKSIAVQPTGIRKIIPRSAITVYPTLVTEQLRIECKDCFSTEYVIYNPMGQSVIRGKLQDGVSTVNVEFLSQGIYYLQVAEQTVKFVKK